MVELLLTNNAKVNIQNEAGETPLHTAASKGRTDVMELLLSHIQDKSSASFRSEENHRPARSNRQNMKPASITPRG